MSDTSMLDDPAAAAPEPLGGSPWLPASLTRRTALVDLLLVLLVLVVLPNATSELWAPDFSGEEKIALNGLALAKWLQAGLAALVAWWLLRRRRLSPAAFGIRFPGMGPTLGWGCAALAGLYGTLLGSAILLVTIALAVPSQSDAMVADGQQRADLFGSMDLGDPTVTAILLVAVALHEELIFRSLLLPYLHRLTGRWWMAIVGGAALFGAMHGAQGVLAIFQAGLLGLVLGAVFVLSRSVWPVVLAHFAFDRLQFELIRTVLPMWEQMQQQLPPPGGGG